MDLEAFAHHLTYINNGLTMFVDIEKRLPLDFSNPKLQELIKLCSQQIIENASRAKQLLNSRH